MGKQRLTAEDFVVAWATSSSLDEVVQQTGMNKAAVQQRCYGLRKVGVKLPKFRRTGFDAFRVAQLNALINKHDIRKKRG